jgi:hypothetical protein
MAHEFKGDIGVAKDARRLSLSREKLKDFVDVGHIEVATETEVLRTPIVTAKERVDILQTTLARCGIAQMAHKKLSLGPLRRYEVEYLSNSIFA